MIQKQFTHYYDAQIDRDDTYRWLCTGTFHPGFGMGGSATTAIVLVSCPDCLTKLIEQHRETISEMRYKRALILKEEEK